MMLLGLLLVAPVEPPRPAEVAQVAVEARAVQVPLLPRSLEEARRGFPAVQKELAYAVQETDRLLKEALEAWKATGWVGSQLAIPAYFEGEALQWSPFLFDRTFLALEEPVLARWNTWQTALLERGLKEDRKRAGRMLLLSSSKQEVVEKLGVDPGGAHLDVVVLDPPRPPRVVVSLRPRPVWAEVVAVDRLDYAADTAFAREARAYADQQAQGLGPAWVALAGHLNASATRLMDLERTASPTLDPAVRALRLRGKVHFLERFRSALWLSQVVWAHMATQRIVPIHQM